jgi:hypothetical protein
MGILKDLISIINKNSVMAVVEPTDLFNKSRLLNFFIQFGQLLGIFSLLHIYNIEKNSGIQDYSWIILLLFLLYSFVKLKYKFPLFLIATAAIILMAYGLLNGSAFIIVGFSIIMICLLNISHRLKLSIVLCLFIVFAIGRTEFFYITRISTLIMYLLPLFMFRVFVFLYELKNGLNIKSFWQACSYFFLLPNIFFLFFPIVDYKNYETTYYNDEEKHIWQKGIRWMLRGVFHIFAYRIIISYFLIDQDDVHNFSSLIQYHITNYSLIIRISGLFHFIIGLLCMFGMNLPKVFDNYFLATSFLDLWRRINIYWRDFVLKLFYYPIMFFYKKRLKKNLLPVTMMTVFFITFILHSYQLFWITGKLNLRIIDLLFWLTIGVFITINSINIERRTLNQKSMTQDSTFVSYLKNTLRIVVMFFTMSLLWGLWSSKNIEEWVYLMSFTTNINLGSITHLFSTFMILIATGTALHYVVNLKFLQKLIHLQPSQTLFFTAPVICITLIIKYRDIIYPQKINNLILAVSSDSPNRFEKNNAEIGYYDRLIEGDEDSAIGIGTKGFKKKLKKNPYNVAYHISDGLLNRRMKPNLNIKGLDHDFITNEFGIRDKPYKAKKNDKTFRFALLGGSYEMGSGVSNNQNFEYITENNLNKHIPDTNYKSIEIWNFAGGGYYLLEHLELLDTEVFKYNPNAVIYFAHSDERNKMLQDLTNAIKRNTDLKYPFLKSIVSLAKVNSRMGNKQIKELLTPYVDVILQWTYIEIAKKCKVHHVKQIWVYLLTTEEVTNKNEYEAIIAMAKKSGYITLNLDNVYSTFPRKAIQISDINAHPNVLGHQLIAKDFYKELMLHYEEIFKK